MTRRIILASITLISILGCASNQKIQLQTLPKKSQTESMVIINDLRQPNEKEMTTKGSPCSRSYGDSFIVPSKLDYLHDLIEQRLAPSIKLDIDISSFQTIERCELSVKQSQQDIVANSGVAGILVGSAMGVPTETVTAGNDFTLQIDGNANKRPFRFSQTFSYADIKFTNFPSESPVYQERVQKCFDAFIKKLQQVINSK